MTDVAREKFVRLMTEIDELESLIEKLESEAAAGAEEREAKRREIDEARERLAERMWELARVTDACKKIHVRR